MPPPGPVAALGALLDAERSALLAGDFATLSDLAPRKETILASLGESPAPPDAALAALRDRALANQALLSAALDGVSAARERLETARSGGPRLQTYDARGRAETQPLRPTVERRA